MTTRTILFSLTAGAIVLAGLPPARVLAQGTTSGPAAGSSVQPNGVGQATSGSARKTAQTTAATAGAPGVAAKQGSESGAAPAKHEAPK